MNIKPYLSEDELADIIPYSEDGTYAPAVGDLVVRLAGFRNATDMPRGGVFRVTELLFDATEMRVEPVEGNESEFYARARWMVGYFAPYPLTPLLWSTNHYDALLHTGRRGQSAAAHTHGRTYTRSRRLSRTLCW